MHASEECSAALESTRDRNSIAGGCMIGADALESPGLSVSTSILHIISE